MTGVEFLACAMQLFPDAKRLLLTAYADTEVAIRAINEIRLDHYLMKPWDPPEERLYPVITDQLEAWEAQFHPGFEGLRVIGHRWSPQAHAVKEFLRAQPGTLPLAGHREPIRLAANCIDAAGADRDAVARRDLSRWNGSGAANSRRACAEDRLLGARPGPLLRPGHCGQRSRRAGRWCIWRLGRFADVDYRARGARAARRVRAPASRIISGFPSGLSGGDLARRAVAQAKRFGAEFLISQEATGLKLLDAYKIVTLADGAEVSCHALLIATGVSYRKLDAPGCEELTGAGVYYGAAATEALSTAGQDVFVVGGGNSAGPGRHVSGQASPGTDNPGARHRPGRDMSKYLIDQIREHAPTSAVRTRSQVTAAHGTTNLEAVSTTGCGHGRHRNTACGGAVYLYRRCAAHRLAGRSARAGPASGSS